jgi:mono/diheme cytochrome c family protein
MRYRLLPPILILGFVHLAPGEDWTLPAEQPVFKAASGAELVQANCLLCHSADYITTQPRFTRDQWKASVTKMQQKYAAPVTAESLEPLLDYLVGSYGKTPAP